LKNIQHRTSAAALLALVFALATLPPLNAQPAAAPTDFSSKDVYRIPDLNGNISFAFNGSYTEATLENNTTPGSSKA
jgi:hypothetical protein